MSEFYLGAPMNIPMPKELKLLPCPACGTPPITTGGISWHEQQEFWIKCKNKECGCCRVGDTVRENCVERWNALPRALTWTTEPPAFGEWNWWRIDTEGRPICRYVYTDGTIDNQMIGRITWQDIGGQWCPVPLPKEPTP